MKNIWEQEKADVGATLRKRLAALYSWCVAHDLKLHCACGFNDGVYLQLR